MFARRHIATKQLRQQVATHIFPPGVMRAVLNVSRVYPFRFGAASDF